MATLQQNKNTRRLREIARQLRAAKKPVPVIDFSTDEEITKVQTLPAEWSPPTASMVPKHVAGLVYVLQSLPPITRPVIVLAVLALLAYLSSRGVGWI
jgi:hypothetical protein